MTEIKAVLFDYGNVLCMPQAASDMQLMAECLGVSFERVETLYWQLRDEYDIGELDGQAYWSQIAAKLDIKPTADQLLKLIELDNLSWTRPNPDMAKWAAKLTKHGIKIAILSNMPISIREYMRGIDWLPTFDHYTFSCDVNAIKPDVAIYQHCLTGVGHSPENTLFIDDREVNTTAAAAIGINSFVFTTARALREYAETTGLPSVETT
ncbi:MAG: HAD family phosphatase [Candidatus Melainabacteria bacterium]|nr:HAD family phosphatase [Candidatus Melainabacteria bacterium]